VSRESNTGQLEKKYHFFILSLQREEVNDFSENNIDQLKIKKPPYCLSAMKRSQSVTQ